MIQKFHLFDNPLKISDGRPHLLNGNLPNLHVQLEEE